MTSFQFTTTPRDCAVIREVQEKNKKTENVKDIVGELDLDGMEKLSVLMTEKGKAVLLDQNIRQYVNFMKECREIDLCLHSKYRVVKKG